MLVKLLGRAGVVTYAAEARTLDGSKPSSDGHARALPNLERCVSELLLHGPFQEATLVVRCRLLGGRREHVARSRVT